jgi:hypothetical protein
MWSFVWTFDKIFSQLTNNGKHLYQFPFHYLNQKTFLRSHVHCLVGDLMSIPKHQVKEQLSDMAFQQKYLFRKMKNKFHVSLLFHETEVNGKEKIDNNTLILIVLNNRLETLKKFLEVHPTKLSNDLLMFCTEFSYRDMYFFLVEKGLEPNLSIYQSAVLGNSLEIIKHIGQKIGVTQKILEIAFQINHTDIILYLIDQIKNDSIVKSSPFINLITYAIMNENEIIINKMEDFIQWHEQLYYSALLSGSFRMIKLIEGKFPEIHMNRCLDMAHSSKGFSSLLLQDIIYDKKYISHTINYAVQSKSLEVVKYIYSLNYKITFSNILTAIKNSTLEIMCYLMKNLNKILPSYFIFYFGPFSFLSEKLEKAKFLLENNYLVFYQPKNVNDHKKESAHLELIYQTNKMIEDDSYDPDYLLNYQALFPSLTNSKMDHKLMIYSKLCLQLHFDNHFQHLLDSPLTQDSKQILVDCLFLFGDKKQIETFYPQLFLDPRAIILSEIACYQQYEKVKILNDHRLHHIFLMHAKPDEPIYQDDLRWILLSENENLINEWIIKYGNNIPKDELKILLETNNLEIIKKFNLKTVCLEEYKDWLEENDLTDIIEYWQIL